MADAVAVTQEQVPARRGVAQRALAHCIRGYRRWGSGRGPFARLRCSFEQTESCSAFGLRVSQSAPSARVALRLIRARIQACGEACVHVDETVSGRPRVHWGALYDSLDAPHTQEFLHWELPATRAAIERMSRVVQHPRAHRLPTRQLTRLLGAPRILLRGGSGDTGKLRRLYVTVWIWSLLLLTLGALSSQLPWLWAATVLVALLGARASHHAYAKLDAWRERREEQRAAAQFELFRLE